MQRFLATVASLAWALWFGGTILLFLAVGSLFQTFAGDHALAGRAASGIFRRFEVYQLVLAALSLLATFAWRLKAGRGRRIGLLFTFLGLATLAAVASAGWVTPLIEQMRLAGQTETEAFRRLHGRSMLLFLSQAVFLLLGGLTLPHAMGGPSRQLLAGPPGE